MNYYILHKFIGLFFIIGLFVKMDFLIYLSILSAFIIFYKKINPVFYKIIIFFMLGIARNYFIINTENDYTLKKTSFKAKIKDVKRIDSNVYLTIYDIQEYEFGNQKHILEKYADLPKTAVVKIKNPISNITIDSEIIAVGRFYPANDVILLEKKINNKIKGVVYDYEVACNQNIVFKDKLREKMKNLSSEAQQLCLAMFLGDTFSVSSKMREDFSVVGLAHILGVSVLNIGVLFYIIYYLILLLLRTCFIRLTNYLPLKYIAQMLSIITMICYCYIIGFDYPLLRSLLISSFNLLSLFIGKKRKEETLFISAACIMCIFQDAIYDIGFQLSFLSVLIIYAFSKKIYNQILSNIYLTFLVTIGTAPVIIYHFHKICMQPILGNFIIMPFFSFIIIPIMNLWMLLSVFNIEYLITPIVNFIFFILIKAVLFLKYFSFLQYFPIVNYKIILFYVFCLCLYLILQRIYLLVLGYSFVIFNMTYNYYQQDFIIVSAMGVALIKKDKIYLNNNNVFFGDILNQAYNRPIVYNDYQFFDRDHSNLIVDNSVYLVFNYQKYRKCNLKTYHLNFNTKTKKIYLNKNK